MRARGIVAALALVLTAGACTADGSDGPDEPAATAASPSAPPEIDAAWSTRLGPAAGRVPRDSLLGYRPHGELDTWGTDDLLVLIGRRGLEAYDVETGEPAWTLEVPARLGSVCAASQDANAAGIGGLLFRTGLTCTTAGAVDLATGRLLWSTLVAPGPVPLRPAYATWPVHVGDRTVTVEVPCDEVRRFDLRTGRALPSPFPRDEACGHTVAVGGGVIAFADKRSDTLTVVDEDSGRRRWQRRFDGGVDEVVSGDPLVLGVSVDGHHVWERYDGRGRPNGYVGREASLGGTKLLGTLDGVAVVSYSIGSFTSPLFRGFDVATGEQLWRGDDLFVGGEQAGQVFLLLRPVTGADERVWVGRADPRDPLGTQVTLGSLPALDDATYGWTDTALVRQVGRRIDVYPMPDPGGDQDAAPMPEVRSAAAEPAWEDDDVRPEQVVDLCTHLRPSTLRSLGLRSADLPVPSDCSWHESLEDPGLTRTVSVEVFALAPDEDRTATERAEQQFDDQPTDDPNWPGPVHPLAGLGEEAQVGQEETRHRAASRLSVRLGNVVVVLHASVQAWGRHRPPAVGDLLAGERRALADLTAALDEVAPGR